MTSRGDCSFKREDQNIAFRTCVCHGQPRNSEKNISTKIWEQIVKSADEFCRVCKCALKTKYGSLGSFVNVFKPCQREGFQQLVVADLCRRAGINLLKDIALSSRICTKCFRKVCTYSKLFDLLSEATNKPIHVESEEIVVTKRAVSYTPGKSIPVNQLAVYLVYSICKHDQQ